MLCFEAHHEAVDYVSKLNAQLKTDNHKQLTRLQARWLAFCITGMIVTNSFCWARFERASAGIWGARALGFMFRKAALPWNKLLISSMGLVFKLHKITNGVLVVDDTERKRAKKTTEIWGAHKLLDKKTGGFINGQELVILLMVTSSITLPVGFSFYRPDPALQLWEEEDAVLKERGVKKKDRPKKPARNKEYPTKSALAIKLMRQFLYYAGSTVKVNAVLADAGFMSRYFLGAVAQVFPQAQFISQLRSNQIIRAGSKPETSIKKYFAAAASRHYKLQIRGGDFIDVTIAAARLQVRSLGKKLFIIALKYKGESDYRYLAAKDLTWRAEDIAGQYSWRWLIEVFNEDWKMYEGWGRVALQQGDDAARNGVLLSVLLDHSLLIHSEQLRLSRQALPLSTVGSLTRRIQVDTIISSIRTILDEENPTLRLQQLVVELDNLVVFRPSTKHLSGKNMVLFGSRVAPTARYANTG